MKRLWMALAIIACVQLPGMALAAEQCLSCHEGIERISEVPGMAELSCTDCHKGDGAATEQQAAHAGMFANPADLRVVDQTCGTCHADEVDKAMKSLHATSAGKISGTRYAWGAQGREGIYANVAVADADPSRPGAVKELKALPFYDPAKPEGPDNTPADDYLRNQCLRCHLWSDGHQRDGDYRASGCAACHVVYSDAGTYEGGDKAIAKDQKDRPRFHRITSKIPETQCLHCHNRGGRTGVSYIGTMESDGYGTPYTDKGGKQGQLHGKNYNHLQADIHYDKGLTCIDCHTKQDLHGDGNIYQKREQAVEIECEDCHGTGTRRSQLTTSWGNPYPNLKEQDGKIVLTSKLDGKQHVVPQLADATLSDEGYVSHVAVASHLEKLECYACHAGWAPQCYGCHAKQDIGKPNGDWLNAKPAKDQSMASHKNNRESSAFAWDESRSYLRWETPTLGINSEGKVSPFIPGCQVVFTQVDGEKSLVHNKVYTTVDGTSGIGTNPIQPHTISKKGRGCADCHMSSKALGLGSGFYDSQKNGLPIDFELERIVDEEGNQLQETAREGARPFNKEEQQRISRSGTCVACHGADPEIWEKAKGKAGVEAAPTDELHRQGIEKLLQKAGKGLF
ncbi:c-type cytochrome [Desulfuromonas versatilis]|uniref:C-type cytochrome n=1 Tax=Desulfuromonas versatilis TaxID=2802975 RepID=A0ABM8HWZ3_9BACT|nr:hypothetical protein [Desulfuromonas versatilis]BCR05625.1 c-type cytochrome [Desulfuromonas versatilis]